MVNKTIQLSSCQNITIDKNITQYIDKYNNNANPISDIVIINDTNYNDIYNRLQHIYHNVSVKSVIYIKNWFSLNVCKSFQDWYNSQNNLQLEKLDLTTESWDSRAFVVISKNEYQEWSDVD